MKVFISWSGDLSHKIALGLRAWLPSVIQAVEPYVSSEDIDKGTRWSTDISKELESSEYGIICVTRENINAPWLNFEAGALSKSLDKSRVSPFLFGIKRSEVIGPLLQFQSTVHEQDDVKKLLLSINSTCQPPCLDQSRLEGIFEVWWPKLQQHFSELANMIVDVPAKGEYSADNLITRGIPEVLEEILELVRNQQKLLSSPDAFLSREYLSDYMRELTRLFEGRVSRKQSAVYYSLVSIWEEIVSLVASHETDGSVPYEPLVERLNYMADPLRMLLDQFGIRLPHGVVIPIAKE